MAYDETENLNMQYETVIGLEVHLQLKTATKIFCGCRNTFGSEPNTNVCPVCLGLPGTLPVLNRQALLYAIKVALAFNCQVNPYIKFDRKNYYYPDLPKGYQISQFDMPIASNGHLLVISEGHEKNIRIKRAHLEEDAGKLIHDNAPNASLVDYNRTGTPLIEIVTEPDLRSPQEAYDYLTALKLNLQYLDVSDCDMEKGSLRCDANVSIRELGATELGTKTELKNMNSFRAVKVALEHEVERHKQIISSGHKIIQETRLWNDEKQVTIAMRSKEEAHDYRYFSEPDLVPFTVNQKIIDEVKAQLPELPTSKLNRFLIEYKLTEYDATIIIQDRALASFFEASVKIFPDAKKICNWMNTALLKELKERKISVQELFLTPKEFVTLIKKVEQGALSNLVAKDVLRFVLDEKKTVDEIIKEKGLVQVSDSSELEIILEQVFNENPAVVEQIKSGKQSAMGFLVGQAMKKSSGKANPKILSDLITRRMTNV